MCDCFHLAFPNWHAASETGASRRLRGPEPGTEDDSACDEPSKLTEGERPRPQGSSPVEEYPETEKYTDGDKEFEAEHDPHHKSGSGKKTKKSGLGSMFEKRSTPKMSKLKEVHSPESGVIVKTTKDGCAEGLVYGGGGKEGIFIKEVVPESPASKSLGLKEGDQVLSATVYFDNMSYEDAIQILDHAQAYKVKLCLKRKPDITETEPVMESDIIPEEDLDAPEMRDQGKTKRRGDARISWPKFPSFGKGRKSRFIRSHSSSEADEQRKLELSPPTSDTESPIKSQDALKGKKRHKMKLSALTKSGRISPSDEQCLESPSGETPEEYVTEDLKVVADQNDQKLTEPQTVQHKMELINLTDSTLKTTDLTVALVDKESSSGMKSPDGKKKKKERSEFKIKILGKDKSHKKDAKAKASPKRLKTLGASVEIADQPENKKSDVIPSFESYSILQGDQLKIDPNTQIISSENARVISAKSVTPQMEMSVPKLEMDVDVPFIGISPQKSEEKMKKAKEIKQKEDTKTGPTFKLPKIGFGDIATDETIQKMNANVEEYTIKNEQHTTEGTEVKDPYEQLSSRMRLPKREEIEIPGMEDISMRTTTKGLKDPKARFMGRYEEPQAETVQLSIDVDSVKEAVSKLPGYKLPEVDTSGVPIPQEITVIDANAQRISVKTPTKVVDAKTKHETHFTRFDITASPDIPKTTMKLPKIAPRDSTSEELLLETKVYLKTIDMKHKTRIYTREDITIPGIESAQEVTILQAKDTEKTHVTEGVKAADESTDTLNPEESDRKSRKAKIATSGFGIAKPNIKIPDVGIYLPKQNISEQKDGTLKGEGTFDIQEVETGTRKDKWQIGGDISDVKIPEIDGIEYIDSVGGSPAKKDGGILLTDFGVYPDAAKPNTDIYIPEIKGEVKEIDAKEHTMKLPKFEEVTTDISINVSRADEDINIDRKKIKKIEREGKGSKFKMPHIDIFMPKVKGPKIDLSLSKTDVDVVLPEAKVEVKLPEVPEAQEIAVHQQDVEESLSNLKIPRLKIPKFGIISPNVSVNVPDRDEDVKIDGAYINIPEKGFAVNTEAPSVDFQGSSIDVKGPEQEGKGTKFEMPHFDLSMPKVKGPKLDFSISKNKVDATLPEAKANVTFPEVDLGRVNASIPDNKMEVPENKVEVKLPEDPVTMKQPECDVEMDAHSGRFKMPKFGIKMPKVKGPQFDSSLAKKDVDYKLSETKADIKLPKVDLGKVDVSIPEARIEVKTPEVEMPSLNIEGELDGQGGRFKKPKFGIKMPKIKAPEFDFSSKKKDIDVTLPQTKAEVKLADAPKMDVHLGKVEVFIPEAKAEVERPELENKSLHAEVEGQGSKVKMPMFGMTIPKGQGPELHLGFSRKDVDVTLPEAKAEVKVPDVELKQPSAEVEIKAPQIKVATKSTEGSPIKFKIPTLKLPKFGISIPSATVEMPDMDKDVEIDGGDIKIPEEVLRVDIAAPSIETEGSSIHLKTTGTADEGKGSKFKMPSLRFSASQVKQPEIDLSLSKKDVDVTLPEAKAEVKLPGVELKQPSAEVEFKAPEIKVATKSAEESLSQFKIPTLKLPKFGISIPSATVEMPDMDKDVKIDGADIKIPEEVLRVDIVAPSIETEGPSIHMKTTGTLDEGKGSKFKMPSLSFSAPQVKRPEIDLSLSKKDVDVTLPEAKAEVKVPDIELKQPSAEVEFKAPEIKVATKSTEGSPSKFKMPTFKLPRFGAGTPSATVEMPEMDRDVKIDGGDIKIPEEVLRVDIAAPSIETEGSSIHMKTTGTTDEGKGSKFKMPRLSFSAPQVKRPEIDLSLSKKDVDVTLPEAKAEVKVPDIELKQPSAEVEIKAPEIKVATKITEESLSQFKIPTLKLPKFGISIPSATVEMPDMDKDVEIDGGDITIPEEVLRVDIAAPSIETEGSSIHMKTTGTTDEGQGSKFKMPSFSFSTPQVKRPEIDLSLSKKDVDVTLPDAKVEVKVPDVELKQPSAEVEIKAPQIKVATKSTEGSPSKFKMPTFKLPRFGVRTPSATVEMPEMDKDVKIDGGDITIPEEVLRVDIAAPSIETEGSSIHLKTTGTTDEGKGSKFKMPRLSFSAPQVKRHEIDLSLSKKDVDVTLPEAKAEFKVPDIELKQPSAEVEIKAPEIKVATKITEESLSQFKIPTLKLPKFGISIPSATVEIPDVDKDVKIDGADIKIPEEVLRVDIAAPSIETEGPSIHLKTTGTTDEGKGSKFKMPRLSFSAPQVKRPEIDLSLSKKDVDVTLPEAKAEFKVPDIELKQPSAEVEIKAPEIKVATKITEESLSQFKIPTLKLPKFGISIPSATVEMPDMDKDVEIDGGDITIPEEVLRVDIAAPSIETEGSSIHMKTSGTTDEGKGSKFKMPSFSFSAPQVKRPEIDLSLSKKDVDVTLPEAKAEVKVPDVELKQPSAEVEIKAPQIKVATKSTEGSPSKFKMPTFKLPRFGVRTPSATVEMPEMNKDVKIDGGDIKIPEEVLRVDIAAPSIETEGPSIHMKTTGTTDEGKGSKFKMPSLSFSALQVERPNLDLSLSKKDVDVTLPEAKAEVKVPDVELKQPSAEVEMKAPEIKVATKITEESLSQFKIPTLKLPKFGISIPSATVEMPDVDKDVKIDGADIKIPEEVLRVDIAAPSIETEGSSIHMKTTGTADEGKGSKFKMPSLSFSAPQVKRPEIDLSLSKKDVDVTLPEAKAEVKLPDVELKQPSAEVEIKAPEIKVATKSTEASPSRFKMPTFKLPRFGVGTPSATVEMPDVDKDVKIDGADIKIPEEVLRVDIVAPSIETEGPSIHMKTTGTADEGKGSKFKMPSLRFSAPQVKRPEIDLSLSKRDVDVTLPEAKAEVKVPDVELKQPSAEVDIKAPQIKVATKSTEGSPSKFKMPTFKLPKFGVGTPSATLEMPDMDKDVKIDGGDITIPEEVLSVDITAPSIETEGSSIHMKTTGTLDEGKGSKFKMPSLSFSAPQVKRPEIDLSLSKKDVDVTLPEAKAEVKVPDVELKQPSAEVEIKAPQIKVATKSTEGSPSKFKMPTFKLPRFGAGTPSATVEMPDMDKDVKIDGGDITIPEEVLRVDIAAPSIETEGSSIHMKTSGTTDEGKGSKFKMPSLSFSAPQVKRPEIDLSLSKKDVDVTLPEAKAEVKVPDVELKQSSAEVEIKAPEIKVATKSTEGSPSKFKMPTFKLPKFGVGTPSATLEMPDMDKDVKIDGGDITIPEEVLRVDIAAPSIETEGSSIHLKTTGTLDEGKGSKFKMPSLSFSAPQVKRPEIDLSLSKKDVDVTLPEAKAEVKVPDVELKQPSAEVEIKAPQIKVATKSTEASPSKFKMPTFKLPRFGAGTPSASVEMPDVDKDVKIDGGDIKISEEVLRVDIAAPSIETEGASIHMKTSGTADEGKGSKFKMPSLSFSAPQVKRPEIDLSLSKKDVDVTLPEAKAEVKVPDVELKQPSAEVEIKAPEIKVATKSTEGSPSKFKMPTFKLPKFGVGTSSATVEMPDVDKDVKIDGGDITIPEEVLRVDIAAPSIETEGPSIHMKTTGTTEEGKGSKFKMPSFSFSAPQVKRPEIDLSLSKKDVDVTLPEAKAEVKVPDVELKQPSAEVEIKAPEIKVATKSTEGSPSKFKMPTFKLPKFGVGTSSATVEMPDMDKDVKIDGADIKIPEDVLSVDIAAPSIDTKGPSIQIKTTGTADEGKASKFKMPSLSFSAPQVKRPEIDISLSKKDVDVTIPEVEAEVELPNVKVKESEATISERDAPTVEVEAKLKRPNWTFPKFSFSRTGDKVPDGDQNLETPKVDVTSPEAKREVRLADVEVQGSLEGISTKEPSAVELDANLKKSKFSLPKFSFSKSNVKAPEVSAELPHVDVSLSEGEVKVRQPEMEIKAPELEAEHDGQGTKFKLPKFNFTQSKAKEQDEDLKTSQKDVGITLPGLKAEVRLPEVQEDDTVNAKGPSVDINMDESRTALTDTEMSKTETVSAGLESPSKFKLPSFKMPKLSFSRPKSEDENAPVETEYKQDQPEFEVEQQGQSKSPKMTLTSFGEIFKNFEVGIDVKKTDKEEEILEPSKQMHETDEHSGKQLEPKERETNTKQDITKSPERTGWFKFPKFGLSSPSEPAKTSEKGGIVDEEISPTCSVQSSDAFADISSAMTSEYVGLSLSSPTKVTVKYSDPNAARWLEEMHSNIITSATRTEVISVEPNLPEKITILSSGASSSSEDTLRLESGKIHVIRSNIQATPEAQQANLLSAAEIQSHGGLPPKSEADETASWTVKDSQGGKRTIYERRLVRETSSERSESKKTIVITKQITHIGKFDSSEPISGETASSIQRLRDTMHSEKMRFFDREKQ